MPPHPCSHLAWLVLFILAMLMGKEMATTAVFLEGKSHGQRNLVGCSPMGSHKSGTYLSILFGIGMKEYLLSFKFPFPSGLTMVGTFS